ncbi:hypothetical protein BKA82DRAFT_1003183, partial [Pisolithus tinctorius]
MMILLVMHGPPIVLVLAARHTTSTGVLASQRDNSEPIQQWRVLSTTFLTTVRERHHDCDVNFRRERKIQTKTLPRDVGDNLAFRC